MSTVAPEVLRNLALEWSKIYKSAKISGIVGDTRHKAQGGYHISRQDQPSNNYSVVRPDDKLGPSDAASAIDMNLSPADMRLCTARLVAAYSNVNDPRRKYLNAFNGTVNNKAARRWDVYARSNKSATADHLWHVHLEIRRRYVNSTVAAKAILSILKGETVATYSKSLATTVAKPASTVATSPVIPKFPGTLRRNDKQTAPNPNVKLFQQQLVKRGWTSIGTADGFFGPKLEAAVKRWQKLCGLSADGVIGQKTWPTVWTRPLVT